MSDSTTMTIRVDRSVKERLDTAARTMNRSKSYLAAQAIEEYLKVQEWQEARINQALEAAERGEGVAHDAVMEWLQSWGADSPLPRPVPRSGA